MTSPDSIRSRTTRIALVALVGLTIAVSGCEKKKKKAPPPPPPPPEPVAVIPDPVDINGVLQSMRPDARVQFPESKAPADRSLAEAVITLASNLAKGDAAGMKQVLASDAQGILDTLVADGTWQDETKKIEAVRVVGLNPLDEAEPSTATVILAVQAPDGAYPLAWQATRSGSSWTFRGMPGIPGPEAPRASDFDNGAVAAGFSRHVEPEPDAAPEDDSGSPTPDAPAPTSPEPTREPGKKSTPAGPITIPGGN